jgi:CBS domain-containing protein
MSAPLIVCRPDDPVRDVARLMIANRVHAIVVEPDPERGGDAPWGVVTDLDLIASGLPAADHRSAADACSPSLTILAADEPAELAAQLMAERGDHHVVVVEPGTRRPVGVLSSLDLLELVGRPT